MGKISINELAAVLMERKSLKKKSATGFVNELFYLVQKGLEQDKIVKVKGLGTFKIIDVDDRESVNVNNGERVLIEGHSKITFTPDALMKELVNKPFSQFETVVLNEGVDFGEESEPEQKTEPEPETDIVEEVDASMAPLVEFVTDNEPQISSEPQPEPQPEPQSTPDLEPQESQEPQSESTLEPEPAPEPQVSSEPHSEPVSEPNPESEPTPDSDAHSEDLEYDYEEESSGNWKKWLFGVLACCVCFAGGYYLGMTYGGPAPTAETKVEAVKPKVQAVQPKVEAPKPKTTKAEAKESTLETEAKPEVNSAVKPEAKPEPKPEVQPESETSLDKYEQMDVRIRTGAYRIVGTDHVEKVKATDNLSRICKRTIGPGMECYLEAYNGIKGDADLKVGQEIKIPKLVHKKKKVKK